MKEEFYGAGLLFFDDRESQHENDNKKGIFMLLNGTETEVGSANAEEHLASNLNNGSAVMLPAPVSDSDTKTTFQNSNKQGEDEGFAPKSAKMLLRKISADRPYDLWFKAAAAFKSAGGSYDEFDLWSQTAPKRYNADATQKLWDSLDAEGGITPATLTYLANAPESRSVPEPMPAPQDANELEAQRKLFLKTLFSPEEFTEVAFATYDQSRTKLFPHRKQENILHRDGILDLIRSQSPKDGVYCLANPISLPLKDGAKAPHDGDVSDLRYVVVEADEMSQAEQWRVFTGLPVIPPVKCATWSGGKSIHFLVRLDAGHNLELYQKRANLLFEYLAAHGFALDPMNKNPARLTRLPGVVRGDGMQYLMAEAFGTDGWEEFEALINAQPKKDRRSETSKINGALGGRPFKNTVMLAKDFLNALGEGTLHKSDKDWYLWGDVDDRSPEALKNGEWDKLSPDELHSLISSALIPDDPSTMNERYSERLVKDIISALSGIKGVFLPKRKFQIPCFLPSGESGKRYICFKNGIVPIEDLETRDLKDCRLLPKDPSFFGMVDCPFDFNPDAKCLMWLEAIDRLLPDADKQETLQNIFGYIFGRYLGANAFFVFQGDSGCGKTTVAEVLKMMMGFKTGIALDDIYSRFNKIWLGRSYLNVFDDMPKTEAKLKKLEGFLKGTCGGQLINAEDKGKDPVQIECTARHLITTNEILPFSDPSGGIWDRLVLLRFDQRIRGTQEDKSEYWKLLFQEASGIFNWAIPGLLATKGKGKFPLPESVRRPIDELRANADPVGNFLRIRLATQQGRVIRSSELMTAYHKSCQQLHMIPKEEFFVLERIKEIFPSAIVKVSRIYTRDQLCITNVDWRESVEEIQFDPYSQLLPQPKEEVGEPSEKPDGSASTQATQNDESADLTPITVELF